MLQGHRRRTAVPAGLQPIRHNGGFPRRIRAGGPQERILGNSVINGWKLLILISDMDAVHELLTQYADEGVTFDTDQAWAKAGARFLVSVKVQFKT